MFIFVFNIFCVNTVAQTIPRWRIINILLWSLPYLKKKIMEAFVNKKIWFRYLLFGNFDDKRMKMSEAGSLKNTFEINRTNGIESINKQG